jgi:putative transposase
MKNKLLRYYGRKELHFITFSCYGRKPFLNSIRAKMVFVKALCEVRERYQFLLVGYVLMPEHVHLLIGEPAKVSPSVVVQVLKQRVSRALRQRKRPTTVQEIGLPSLAEQSREAGFWQRRFHDFNVYSRGKVREKLNYMHANPVVRKLVKHPKDWPWSSWSCYELGERGLIQIDAEDIGKFNWEERTL